MTNPQQNKAEFFPRLSSVVEQGNIHQTTLLTLTSTPRPKPTPKPPERPNTISKEGQTKTFTRGTPFFSPPQRLKF